MSAGASFGIDSTSNRLAQVLAAGVAGLAIGSFVLSFNALRDVAEAAGIPGELAFAWPLIVDGFIVVATLAAFALRSRGLRVTWYPWATLIAFGIVSVIGNALHVQTLDPGRVRLDSTLAVAVSSVPPIALLVASHLLVVMISGHERTKGSRSAAVAPTPAQVTVSAPAAEPVAVSEPATQPIPVAARPATWPRLETVTVDDGRPAAAIRGHGRTAGHDRPAHRDRARGRGRGRRGWRRVVICRAAVGRRVGRSRSRGRARSLGRGGDGRCRRRAAGRVRPDRSAPAG